MFKYLFLILLFFVWSCDQKKKETSVGPTTIGGEDIEGKSRFEWLNSSFDNIKTVNTSITITKDQLLTGTVPTVIPVSYSLAEQPLSVFQVGKNDGSSVIPFLAFATQSGAKITAKFSKTVNNVASTPAIFTPSSCPSSFSNVPENYKPEETEAKTTNIVNLERFCIPLIDSVLTTYLNGSDGSITNSIDFNIIVKEAKRDSVTINVKVNLELTIPASNVSITINENVKKLSLKDRLLIATNDLKGLPRRDFKVFDIKTEQGSGDTTAWVLTFKNVKMMIKQEIFFENMVLPYKKENGVQIVRGYEFYKRNVEIDSVNHFRIRVLNNYKENAYYTISSVGNSVLSIPIEDGQAPLFISLIPDFANETSTKQMASYLKPLAPEYCPLEFNNFQPEEWRQSTLRNGYVACEANTQTKIVDEIDAQNKGINYPIETFFGSFNYLSFQNGKYDGGSDGIFSQRLVITGTLVVAVRSRQDVTKTITVATKDLSFSYMMPTAIDEMNQLVINGNSPDGLENIMTSILKKGFLTLPNNFPLMGQDSSKIIY